MVSLDHRAYFYAFFQASVFLFNTIYSFLQKLLFFPPKLAHILQALALGLWHELPHEDGGNDTDGSVESVSEPMTEVIALGKVHVELTMKLNIHWKATAMATAAPRMVFGKSSAISTHAIGPQENMKLALYTMMLTIVTVLKAALPKVKATPRAPTAIPMEPQISKGLRPNFSTVNTATKVNEMFTIPMMTV